MHNASVSVDTHALTSRAESPARFMPFIVEASESVSILTQKDDQINLSGLVVPPTWSGTAK